MGRVLTVLIAALMLAGCTVPSTSTVAIPTYSPVREALAYFPASAPVLVVFHTDPQDPGVRRAAGLGALAPLRRAMEGAGLSLDDLRPLLGNPAVAGQPFPGAAPLAVLATHDPGGLEALARERVTSGAADAQGRYRGADLYQEIGWAFAVRDRVLLMSRSTHDLMEALDRRVAGGGFEAAQLNDVLPDWSPPATFARGYVDLSAIVAARGAQAREVPLLRSLGRAGVSIGATPDELRAAAATDISGAGLTADDVPGLEPTGGERPVLPAGRRGLAVADFSSLARAVETAVRAALPVSALKIDALRSRLSEAKVAFVPELFDGAAVVVDGPLLRLLPARPAELEDAVARAANRLKLRGRAGLYRFRGVTFGFTGGSFVAGRAPAARLRQLASRATVPVDAPLLVRVPRLADWFPRPLELRFSGSTERITLAARAPF